MGLFRKKKSSSNHTQTIDTISNKERLYLAHVELQKDDVKVVARRLTSYIDSLNYKNLPVVQTMASFVSPFLKALGWNTENPVEVSVATAPGAADTNYTLNRHGVASVLISVTGVSDSPFKKYDLLAQKFSTSPADVAILTNGIDYALYSSDNSRELAPTPFASFSITDIDIDKKDVFLTYLFRYDFQIERLLVFRDVVTTNYLLSSIFCSTPDIDISDIRKMIFERKYKDLKHPSVEELLYFSEERCEL